ncbi:MAG TPA: response regulator transcription factor [Chloroflexi bacterium]|nr:response regulator transcription factor [Chloroflexota bacterium]
MRVITVLLVEDHHLVREGLRALLEEQGGFEIVGQAQDGHQALELAEKLRPDVVVMDITMPNLNGLEATVRLRGMLPSSRVIILSQHRREEYVAQALLSGADGYLVKDAVADELALAIRAVFRGQRYLSAQISGEKVQELIERRDQITSPLKRLTPREREVLQLVAEGNTNRQIAARLSISVKTVEKHRFRLMEKLNIRDVTGLVRFAIAQGIIEPDDSPHLP